MAAWTDNEIYKLIDIWGDQTIQEQLEGCRRNREVFEKISKLMHEAGYDRTGTQCREKIKKLKVDYRKVKDKNNQTGNNRKDTKFYYAMNEILGTKPTTQPPVVIDSSAESPADVSKTLDDDVGNRESPFTESNAEDSGVSAANTNDKDDSADADASADTSATDQGDVKLVIPGMKRKKNIKLEKMEKAMDKICERVTKGQVESDKLFVELEEKRMKLDYEMMRMEQDRRREEADRAERQKREEREFQLQLFSMMCSSRPDSLYPSQRYYFPQSNDYNDSSS